MKRIIIAICCIIAFQNVEAQTDNVDSLPIYQRFPEVPVFSITRVPDSTKFTRDDLKKRKPTIIMLFSPDCSHCQVATKDMLAHIDLFKKAQIVMVSSLDYSNIKKFYDEYKIGDQHNIIMGRDGTYNLGTFYKLRSYPSIFVYNKKGKFVDSFVGDIKMDKIAEAL
jgi:thioredoxin-related protein